MGRRARARRDRPALLSRGAVAIGLLDYLTPSDVDFSRFSMLLVVLVAWLIGWTAGIGFALVSVITAFIADSLFGQPAFAAAAWNGLSRFAVLSGIAIMTDRVDVERIRWKRIDTAAPRPGTRLPDQRCACRRPAAQRCASVGPHPIECRGRSFEVADIELARLLVEGHGGHIGLRPRGGKAGKGGVVLSIGIPRTAELPVADAGDPIATRSSE